MQSLNLNKYLEIIYNFSDVAIFIFDVIEKENDFDYRFITTNSTHQKLTGISLKEIENKTLFELKNVVPIEFLKEIKKKYDQCVLTKKIFEYKEKIIIKEKETHWLTKLFPIIEDNKVKTIIGMSINISYEVELESKFEQQFRILEKILQNSPVGIAVTNSKLHIIYYNSNFLKLWNIKEEEIKNDKLVFFKILKQLKNRKLIYPKIIQAFRERKNDTFKYLILNNKIIEMNVFPVFGLNQELDFYVGIYIDRTKDFLQKRRLKKALQKAEIANKSKTEFLANISHELRTPLTTIIGLSEILYEQENSELNKKYIKMIHNSSNYLLNLIQDILDLSSIELGNFQIKNEPFYLSKISDMLVQNYKFHCQQKNLEFKYKTNLEKDIILIGDEKRIYQILNNLLNNSVKFTPIGYVELNILQEKIEENKIQLTFEVIDTGIGIEKKHLPYIFDKFKKFDEWNINPQGTGIGLSLVKEFVKLMKGKIYVESEVGKGTKFSIKLELPYLKDKQEELQNLQFDEIYKNYLPYLNNKKILIAEDSKEIQLLIKKFLENTNLQIFIVNDGFEAISKAKEIIPDLIFLDIRMPLLNGYETLKQIREFSNVPIIAFTAYSTEEDKKTIFDSGFSDHLKKPFSKKDLLLKIITNLIKIRTKN